MPIAFVIREATLSDVHAIATLLSDLGYPTTPDTMSARLAPILENPEHRIFVVVCDETQWLASLALVWGDATRMTGCMDKSRC